MFILIRARGLPVEKVCGPQTLSTGRPQARTKTSIPQGRFTLSDALCIRNHVPRVREAVTITFEQLDIPILTIRVAIRHRLPTRDPVLGSGDHSSRAPVEPDTGSAALGASHDAILQ
jgi:hypothetical protein